MGIIREKAWLLGYLGENAIDAKAKASLQPLSILKKLDQHHPQSNYLTYTTVTTFQASVTQDTRDIPFASSEKA